jgi:ketosteroid isomerase-like protein
VAYESGAAEITVTKDGKPVMRFSRYLTVWQGRADGEWKIISNIVVP